MKQFALDSLEKAFSTFIQVVVVMLFAEDGSILVDPQWSVALAAGAVAAAVSVLTSLASIPVPELPPLLDLGFRVVKTFLQAFVGALVVTGSDVDWRGALTTAFPVALLALLKGLAAMHVPGTEPGPGLVPESLVQADPGPTPEPPTPPDDDEDDPDPYEGKHRADAERTSLSDPGLFGG